MLNKYILLHNMDKKLDTITYRLLAKHKQENSVNNRWLSNSIPYNGKYEEKYNFNDILTKGKNKKTNDCSINNIKCYEQARKGKSFVYTGRDSYFEKRMLDNIHFLNNFRGVTNANINNLREKTDNNYKAISFLPGFLALVGFPIVLVVCKSTSFNIWTEQTASQILIAVLFLVVSIFVLLAIAFACKKIKKHEKSTSIMSEIHNRDYRSFPNL
ncbi:Plasmodium exported protein (Pm-fam-a like), unknown function [Plasmodium malariae]|uniref:Uncharacterized protein n=1 Tax=Plasmodium malariae TaxID=5858 RepID=A0A1A8WGV2_PLAMA|nr:Plasmodium exported protein (Pm-fam-a like), unknown function [Plasmodium malariae]